MNHIMKALCVLVMRMHYKVKNYLLLKKIKTQNYGSGVWIMAVLPTSAVSLGKKLAFLASTSLSVKWVGIDLPYRVDVGSD